MHISVSANKNLTEENYKIFKNNSIPIDVEQYITDTDDLIHSNFTGVIRSGGQNQTSDSRDMYDDFIDYEDKLILRESESFKSFAQWNDLTPKAQVLHLMIQIIYTMRYRIKNVEPLRIKYRTHDKYKMGFLFGKMKVLRRRMNSVFSTSMNNKRKWDFQYHLLLYNKLVYINVDVHTFVARVSKIHERYKLEDPSKNDFWGTQWQLYTKASLADYANKWDVNY